MYFIFLFFLLLGLTGNWKADKITKGLGRTKQKNEEKRLKFTDLAGNTKEFYHYYIWEDDKKFLKICIFWEVCLCALSFHKNLLVDIHAEYTSLW